MNVWTIIVAAGQGRRFATALPKQFLDLAGQPLLVHSMSVLLGHGAVEGAIVALPRGFVRFMNEEILPVARFEKPVKLIVGGQERADSVRRALAVLPARVSHVMIHDGVRPLIDDALLDRLLEGVLRYGAVIPGIPVVDTLKEISTNRRVIRTLDRSRIVAIQTPQVFRRELIENAYRKAGRWASRYTDCAGIVEHFGQTVHVVSGDRDNLKVTTPRDLFWASQLMTLRASEAGVTKKNRRLGAQARRATAESSART